VATPKSGHEGLPGHTWQDLCIRVLRAHHPAPRLIVIPDDDGGDRGLEAFSTDGHAYQCYSPEQEPLATSARVVKQAGKMRDDVGKLIKNETDIARYIPPGVFIERWVLLVPYINSRKVHEAAAKQTVRLRDARLCFASANVIVSAHTLADYDTARLAVIRTQTSRLNIPEVQAVSYGQISDDRIGAMRAKLDKVPQYANHVKRDQLITHLLQNHTTARGQRDWINDQLPELGAELDSRLNDLEQRLAMHYPLNHPEARTLFAQVLRDAESTVQEILNTGDNQSRTVATGQIAHWLMQCPLDFG
jgi:hypothetical protein